LEKVGAFFGMAPGAIKPPAPAMAGGLDGPAGDQKAARANTPLIANSDTQRNQNAAANAAAEESLRAQARLRELNLSFERQRLTLQAQLVGKDDFTRATETARLDVQIKKQQEIQRLTDDIKKMEVTAANEKGGAAKYSGQLKILRDQLATVKNQEDTTTGLVAKIESAKMVDKARLDYNAAIVDKIKQQYEITEKFKDAMMRVGQAQNDVKFEASLIGLGPTARQNAEIRRNARQAYEAARDTLTAGFDEGSATSEELAVMEERLTALKKGYDAVAAAQSDNLDAARQWTAGWSESWATFVDNADNAAQHIKTIFDTATKGMEDAFVNFAHTGKLSFKSLANSILDDLIRIGIRKSIMNFGDLMGFGAKGSVSVGGLFGGFGSLFGGGTAFSGGGNIPGFAAGGSVIGDRPILVGERGPELFTPNSGGSITANDQMGTNVTYTINAVDAASFRSMIARDPQFIYNITEVGRRSTPQRRLS
jgi:lambda family phage tail tape measure protein